MGNFDGKKRFGSNRKFGGVKKSFGQDNRNFGAKFKAICSECGVSCDLPFKPTGSRPVYCSNCFSKQQEFERPNRFDNDRSFDKPRHDRKKFDAVCAKCGLTFQLPFRPVNGKEVFCDNCFEKPTGKSGCDCAEQLKTINDKLDKIFQILNTKTEKTTPDELIINEAVKEEKKVKKVKASNKKK